MRAVRYAQEKRIEVIAKQGVLDADVDLDELDQHDADQHLQWKNSTFLDDGRNGEDILKGEKVDRRGIDYNWSVSSFAGERDTTLMEMHTTAPRRLHANNWKSPMQTTKIWREGRVFSRQRKLSAIKIDNAFGIKYLQENCTQD